MPIDLTDAVMTAVKIAIVLGAMLNITPIMVWVERRGSALMQDRVGPNRIGPLGLLQSIADALKFILKEDVVPAQAHRVLYTMAPLFGLIPALTTIAVVPFGRAFVIPDTLTYDSGLAFGLFGAIMLMLLLAAGTAAATVKFRTRPAATRLNVVVGWIVTVSLVGVALVLLAALLAMKSAGSVHIPGAGHLFEPIVADVNIGLLLVFALASMSVYGLATAGWASSNKYSLLGGIRASAQMISYELALTLSTVGALMAAGSLRLVDVVARQTGYFVLFDTVKIPAWNCLPMFLGFVVFVVSAFAETNRTPFDFAEADAELVAGYHTEYSSMKFAMFFMSEYMAMGTMSALIVTLFLGGWDIPYYHEPATFFGFLFSAVAFLVKISIMMFVFVWVRWTIPRLKYDILMRIGWKVFLPLALINVVVVALLIAAGWV
ncbi:MAG TPA: complex I subunit 1 family protein [Thermoanaerobaculia bacterium]|nr:complex I subunit 1 family protein [Thermoanaerobaculia bacterium]